MKAFLRYKWKTKVFHFPRVSLLPYNSHTLSCTAEIDISLKSSQNGGWHRLDCYPIRSSFHRWKRGKRVIWSFLCSVFHVFNDVKWNGLKIKPAYVTRLFKSFPGIYRSPLYMKAVASYKVTTKEVKKVLRKKKKRRKECGNHRKLLKKRKEDCGNHRKLL